MLHNHSAAVSSDNAHLARKSKLGEIREELQAILTGNIRILSLEDLTRQMIAMSDLIQEMDGEIEALEGRRD